MGKTAVAEALADRVDSEIVSADSMQVYRGMDIATDKPGTEARARHRYHMVDVADPDEPFTVVKFRKLGRAAIARISAAGRLPIVLGGSGLYVRALIDDLKFTPAGRELSDQERAELQNASAEELYAKLEELDPPAAVRIHRNNRRRLARALEFIAETGEPFSEMQEAWSRRRSIYDARIFGMERRKQSLYTMIDRRIDKMITDGLVEEARRFLESGVEGRWTSRQALGYKEMAAYLSGEHGLGEAADELRRATKRFAKRQMTWFRADDRVQWIDVDDLSARETAEEIIRGLRKEGWLDAGLILGKGSK